MARVICTIKNASDNIDGIQYRPHKLGMISEEIDEATAARLLSVEGYIDLDEAKAERISAGSDAPESKDAGDPETGAAGSAPETETVVAKDGTEMTGTAGTGLPTESPDEQAAAAATAAPEAPSAAPAAPAAPVADAAKAEAAKPEVKATVAPKGVAKGSGTGKKK